MDTFRQQGKYQVWTLNGLVNAMDLDFTRLKISPSSRLLGIALGRNVKVYQLHHETFCHTERLVYHVDFIVEDIKWSPDSKSLLIMSLQDSVFIIIQFMSSTESVFRVQGPRTVDLLTVEWVPDSKHVVSVSKHNVYAFAHSMIDGQRILLPTIFSSDKGKPLMTFSPDGKYLVSVSFSNMAFHASLISTSTWCVLWKTKLGLKPLQGLDWCPKSTLIALWDSSHTISFLELNGEIAQRIQYNSLTRSSFVTTIFSPNSDLFIAACCQDEKIKILVYNLNTWRLSSVLDHMENNYRDRLKDTKLGECLGSTPGHPFNVKNQFSISHCGGLLVSSLIKGLVIIWNLRDNCQLIKAFQFPKSYAGLVWHPKKTNLCLAIDGEVILWKLRQEGAITPKASMKSLHLNLGTLQSLSWSKKKLVFCSVLCAITFIRTDT